MNKFNESFENMGLSLSVKKSIEVIGYTKPTKVQALAIPEVLNNVDVVVKSETGSGKTAAFGIPIVDKLKPDIRSPQVLVLTPTRELAVQVSEEINLIGKYKKVRCLPIYGKQPIHIQMNQLKQRVHIAVGTPGRVTDLIKRGNLKVDAITHLVIDEADEMLNRGFLEEVTGIIEFLPTERTTMLFSATMPEEIEKVSKDYMKNAKWIEVVNEEEAPKDIFQLSYEVNDDWKFIRLKQLLDYIKPGSCLVFCNTQRKVDQLHGLMKNSHFKTTMLHGGMNQRDRLRAIDSFKRKEVPYLIATDLAARGIHIDALDLVINYELPIDKENYVHRIGRTGRAGQKGLAISFVTNRDQRIRKEIEDYIGSEMVMGNIEELQSSLGAYLEGANIQPPKSRKELKSDSSLVVHKDITKLRINVGKKKKIRPVDVVGAIGNIQGILPEDIGIVEIRDGCTYIDIFNNKGDLVINGLTNVKGKNTKVVKILKPR